MKLLLLADGYVGTKITEWLINNYKEDLALVVIKDYLPVALSGHGVPWISIDGFSSGDYDLGIMAWWPDIIKEPLLSLPKHGWINTHPSLLPYCRGKHYNFWTIVDQLPFGVTLHMVEKTTDTGAIVFQKEIPYTWEDTGESLYLKAREAIIDLFKETYPVIRTLDFPKVPQDESKATFHHSKKLDYASEIFLDKIYSARNLLNMLRARTFGGHPACWFTENGIEYEVRVEITMEPRGN